MPYFTSIANDNVLIYFIYLFNEVNNSTQSYLHTMCDIIERVILFTEYLFHFLVMYTMRITGNWHRSFNQYDRTNVLTKLAGISFQGLHYTIHSGMHNLCPAGHMRPAVANVINIKLLGNDSLFMPSHSV